MPDRMPEHPRRLRLTARALALAAGLAVLSLAVSGALLIRALPDGGTEAVALPTTEPLLVFAEFGPAADRLYVAPATDPSRRTLVETIEHATGWGINPTIASGGTVAYTLLPAGVTPERDTPAELWVLYLATGERIRLARDADLLVAPVFADGGEALIYRRSAGILQELVRVEIEGSTRATVHAEQTAFGIFPIGFDADQALIFARLSTEGTDVLSVRAGDPPVFLFHASDHIARDWRVSPDGRTLAFLAPVALAERVVHRAHVVALTGLEARPLPPALSASGEQYGPTWTPDGAALTVGQEADVVDAAPAVTFRLVAGDEPSVLPPPERGFDVPLEWSPDGRYLAARTFDGVNSVQSGTESAVVIGTDGTRRPVTAATEVILIGWYVHG